MSRCKIQYDLGFSVEISRAASLMRKSAVIGRQIVSWVVCAGTLVVLAICTEGAMGSPGIDQTGNPTKVAKDAPLQSLPSRPSVLLAPVEGFESDSTHSRMLENRVDDLVARLNQSTKAPDRVDLQLAAANVILSYQLESACTRRMLSLKGQPDDAQGIRRALQRIDQLLSDAHVELEKLGDSEVALDEGWLVESQKRYHALRAFAGGIGAYLNFAGDAESQPELLRSASRLSRLLEDSDPQVSAAASLWHAVLRISAGDADRVLSGLDRELVDPSASALPYALFARLLRCQLTAQRGGYASALSLLMQIEERCDDWLKESSDQENARRAAQFMRLQIMADWHAKLDGANNAAERQWCVDRSKELADEAFSDVDTNRLYRLQAVIPIIAPEPAKRVPSAQPTPGND